MKRYSKKFSGFYFGGLQNEKKLYLHNGSDNVIRVVIMIHVHSLNDNSQLSCICITITRNFYLAEGDIHVRVMVKGQQGIS